VKLVGKKIITGYDTSDRRGPLVDSSGGADSRDRRRPGWAELS